MNLRIVYTCNMKSFRKLKNWEGDVRCMVDRNHQRSAVVVDHSKNFKGV